MKKNFPNDWLIEFPSLALDADLGIIKCKIFCTWANVCDPKSPLVIGSNKFRKDLLYAKSAHHAACVMRNDRLNKSIKDMPMGKLWFICKRSNISWKVFFNSVYAYNNKKLGPSVVFYVRLSLLKEHHALKCIANQMSCLYLFITTELCKIISARLLPSVTWQPLSSCQVTDFYMPLAQGQVL